MEAWAPWSTDVSIVGERASRGRYGVRDASAYDRRDADKKGRPFDYEKGSLVLSVLREAYPETLNATQLQSRTGLSYQQLKSALMILTERVSLYGDLEKGMYQYGLMRGDEVLEKETKQ